MTDPVTEARLLLTKARQAHEHHDLIARLADECERLREALSACRALCEQSRGEIDWPEHEGDPLSPSLRQQIAALVPEVRRRLYTPSTLDRDRVVTAFAEQVARLVVDGLPPEDEHLPVVGGDKDL